MKMLIPLAVAGLLVASAWSAESFEADGTSSARPVLKLLKKKAGEKQTKRVIIRDGKRMVVIKVKKVKKQTAPEPLIAVYVPPAAEPEAQPETPVIEESVPVPAVAEVEPTEANTTVAAQPLPSEPEAIISPEVEEPAPLAPVWNRHFVTFAAGTTSREQSVLLDETEVASETASYGGVELGYAYRPAPSGSSLLLGGYYDEDIKEVRLAYKYSFATSGSFYPFLRIGAAGSYYDKDDVYNQGYSGAIGTGIEKRFGNGLFLGIDLSYAQRNWNVLDETAGEITWIDKEGTLKLTLDIPLF